MQVFEPLGPVADFMSIIVGHHLPIRRFLVLSGGHYWFHPLSAVLFVCQTVVLCREGKAVCGRYAILNPYTVSAMSHGTHKGGNHDEHPSTRQREYYGLTAELVMYLKRRNPIGSPRSSLSSWRYVR
jgi:hypothetical protein